MNVNLLFMNDGTTKSFSTTKAQCRPYKGDRYVIEGKVVFVTGVVQNFGTGEFIATVELEKNAETKPQQRDASGAKDVQHQQGSGAGVSGVRRKGAKRKAHPAAD